MPPKLTNPLRPVARYRKGKPLNVPVVSDSDSDQDEEQAAAAEQSDEEQSAAPSVLVGRGNDKGKMNVALKGVEVDDKGAVKVGGRGEVGRTRQEVEDEEGSSEYGAFSLSSGSAGWNADISAAATTEDESEEEKPKPMYKPKMPTADSDEAR
jgi:microfibrillar-associated protein 1